MLRSLRSLRQDAFYHGGFWVPWVCASQMTGSSGGQPDQHRKEGLCRRQGCAPNTERGLWDWTLCFWSRECNTERWILAAGSWDLDWRCSNRPWGSFYVLLHVSRLNTVARLHIDESVPPNETSSGSSKNWSWHLTPWKPQSNGWYYPARCSISATSQMESKYQHLFLCPPFASLQVPFPGHWLCPLPFCWLAGVRKHLWRCWNDARLLPCSSLLHHCEIDIVYTYKILTMPVCTQLHDWIRDAELGFCIVVSGLRLRAGTGSFPSSPSHSIEKLPHMTHFLV